MTTLLLAVHVMVALFLIFIVLIQSGKGAELGAAFGGSSQTLFGSRGSATFFSKLTTIAAVAFMLTSLSLAIVSTKGGSVVKTTTVKEKTDTPAAQGPISGGGVQPSQQPPQMPAQPAGK
ncbi:MAG: preprotein translocase subunit SecG [Nitrospirae bacterium CG_4_10_14_3_um_filter_44_29]|nr:preprotein translocase subunit SecG [Nitrospirota bacterium]OIO28262.1 MAG: preprotein translocase subunit SecG [Nitrospirae bacterium CG1_02_44_142]PIP70372.1 MAG: preprotein translocase subunit SecG [Nitrospirae bacterium CG22_combo_CG10-13_8_21_14_all_44_11]PIV41504.1 MAG: preprotein translocase subunit SecG [Nitrospirae bacterium CG02_land_8_20_14_3_00_44_33]PIV65886.1 MAG: preprotein translocase subunit SecG [Nitrospirae bacterium CG01_land_8_20_14_3_00_44_22]PIW90312.1 MAG: preprotein